MTTHTVTIKVTNRITATLGLQVTPDGVVVSHIGRQEFYGPAFASTTAKAVWAILHESLGEGRWRLIYPEDNSFIECEGDFVWSHRSLPVCLRCGGATPSRVNRWGEFEGPLSKAATGVPICAQCSMDELRLEAAGLPLAPRDKWPVSTDLEGR